MINRVLIIVFSFLSMGLTFAQELTIEDCYKAARENYPEIKQLLLIEQTKEISLDNAAKGILPQLVMYGQATYQSQVTEIPIDLPAIPIPEIPKDQYRLSGEVTQSITGLILNKDNIKEISNRAEIDKQKTETELYHLRDRINKIFFGILLIDAKIEQMEFLKKDIMTGVERMNVAVSNGIAIKSDVDKLKAEILKADQNIIELNASRKGLSDMLALFTGMVIDENTVLKTPSEKLPVNTVNRPELRLFDLQLKSVDLHQRILDNRRLPNVSIFLQGGLGRPGLDMLDPDFSGYFIGGLRFVWNLNSYLTRQNDSQRLILNRQSIGIQKENFLFSNNLMLKQQNAEMVKYRKLMETDQDIIRLHENIKQTTEVQLENGTATSNDYLTAVTAVSRAKQDMVLHRLQLLQAEYNILFTEGNN
ncbi:MAG: TolC family protein [Saprospiraceae bacterium]|nr:TolC family protein [Saprospiraceae bacterium]